MIDVNFILGYIEGAASSHYFWHYESSDIPEGDIDIYEGLSSCDFKRCQVEGCAKAYGFLLDYPWIFEMLDSETKEHIK